MKAQRFVTSLALASIAMLTLTDSASVVSPFQNAERGRDLTARSSATINGERVMLKFWRIPELDKTKPKQRDKLERPQNARAADQPSNPTTETASDETKGIPTRHGPANVPEAFKIFRNTILSPSATNKDNNEPSVANSGGFVFYTGNKYAARSTDGGETWQYVDPYLDFSNFCCDQDVIYDRSRNLLFWFRLSKTKPAYKSEFRLGVSTDAGKSFCFWNWRPIDFDLTIDVAWDFPHLALSDNFIYLTLNAYRPDGGKYVSMLARAPLDSFQKCAGSSWTYWMQESEPFGCLAASDKRVRPQVWAPVQGARDAMYLGQTTTNSCFTVWRQPEGSTMLEQYRIPVPSWTVSQTDAAGKSTNLTCPLANGGGDPCQRLDHRVSAGWVAKGTVGFFWNAAKSDDFPYPYVDAATFHERTLSYKGRPYIWNRNYAWAWAAVYPNERGDLGIASWRMGDSIDPELYVGIDDQFNGDPPPWEVISVASSTTGPRSDLWGDYLRVRSHDPANRVWTLSGFVSVEQGGVTGVSQPHFAIFGRAADESSINTIPKPK